MARGGQGRVHDTDPTRWRRAARGAIVRRMRNPALLALAPLAALLIAPRPAAAQSPRWKELGRTNVGNTVFVDQRSVKKGAAGVVTGTFRVAFAKPVKSPRGDITSSRTVASLDCTKRLVAIRENVYYHDERANRVYERKVVAVPGWAPPMGGSMPEVAMGKLCGT